MPIFDLSSIQNTVPNGKIVERSSDVVINTTKANLFVENLSVKGFTLTNDGDFPILFKFGGDPLGTGNDTISETNYDIKLNGHQYYECPFPFNGNLQSFAPGESSAIRFLRYS